MIPPLTIANESESCSGSDSSESSSSTDEVEETKEIGDEEMFTLKEATPMAKEHKRSEPEQIAQSHTMPGTAKAGPSVVKKVSKSPSHLSLREITSLKKRLQRLERLAKSKRTSTKKAKKSPKKVKKTARTKK